MTACRVGEHGAGSAGFAHSGIVSGSVCGRWHCAVIICEDEDGRWHEMSSHSFVAAPFLYELLVLALFAEESHA